MENYVKMTVKQLKEMLAQYNDSDEIVIAEANSDFFGPLGYLTLEVNGNIEYFEEEETFIKK